MAYLMNFTDIEKTYGVELLFKNLSLGISKGDKIGVIGPNGAGKSTFLKIAAGMVSPDFGDINRIKGLNCVYLTQDPEFEDDARSGKLISEKIEEIALKYPGKEGEIRKVAGLSGFSEYEDLAVSSFSGGMKKKLALTLAMMELPDILLLDEPTNHLDLEGIKWLENILLKPDFTFITVSHDREFLNNSSNKIIEISPIFPGSHFMVKGNYNFFINKKYEFLDNQSEKVLTLANKMRRESEWLSRSPKARTTKAKFRIDAAGELREELGEVKKRNNIDLSPKISFQFTGRKTKRLITIKNISRSWGEKKLFEKFSLNVENGARFSIVGNNGSGKTSLMDIISGKQNPDSGSVKHVENLKVVFFDQERALLDKDKTPKDILAPESDFVTVNNKSLHIITWLKKFGIDRDQVKQPISSLSGGEQARILMADLVRTPVDIIFLDEPTNDLDIPTIEMLEQALSEFEGAIFLVTHDRYFAKSIGSSFICLDGGGDIGIYADLKQWEDFKKNKELKNQAENKKEKKIAQPAGNTAKKTKLSYKYQLELDTIEDRIADAESLVKELENKIADPEIMKNAELYSRLCIELKDAMEDVDAVYERWEFLEELKSELE